NLFDWPSGQTAYVVDFGSVTGPKSVSVYYVVTFSNGETAKTNTLNISVAAPTSTSTSLTVSFSYSPSQTVRTGVPVTVTAEPSGGCGGYTFLWGDGSTAQQQTFVYSSFGTYGGHVTVTDSCGNSVTEDWSVTVLTP
ncbi:MAG: hypothetical protein QXI37_03320, partial [Thermoprotei archaeon]